MPAPDVKVVRALSRLLEYGTVVINRSVVNDVATLEVRCLAPGALTLGLDHHDDVSVPRQPGEFRTPEGVQRALLEVRLAHAIEVLATRVE